MKRLEVWSLASGSSGNALLVRGGRTVVLVDCGISCARALAGLRWAGIAPADLDAVLLSHEHSDHLQGVPLLRQRLNLPVYATAGTLRASIGLDAEGASPLPGHGTVAIGDLLVTTFPVPHDAAEPVGFAIEFAGERVVVATDLGHVPSHLLEECRQADLVVLEANHCPAMLASGPYPHHLKVRIRGDDGHLSNQQTAEAIASGISGAIQTFWLAHLSRTNNSPPRALAAAQAALAAARAREVALAVARRDRPSLHWRRDLVAWQPRLF